MGKKTQARPGLDGLKPGTASKATRKARRVAAKETKARKKQLIPGKKRKVEKIDQLSELQKLRQERESQKTQREQRRKELEKAGALYNETAESQPKYATPPHRWNISVRKKVVFCEVTLHKVPTDKINCSMTEKKMTVDTLQHSKKWLLETEYPHGIKVDPNGLAEVNDGGILKIKLRITHMPKEVVDAEHKKQQSLKEMRSLRFRSNEEGEVVVGKKRKLQDFANNNATDDQPAKKQAKKQKVFVTDKQQALSLIQTISNKEESKKKERKTMHDHLQDIKAERKQRRIEKRAKKETMQEQAVKQINQSKKAKRDADIKAAVASVIPLKKPTGKKVKFASA